MPHGIEELRRINRTVVEVVDFEVTADDDIAVDCQFELETLFPNFPRSVCVPLSVIIHFLNDLS
jgi:hypothetical protein